MAVSLIDGFVGERRLLLGEVVDDSDPLVIERPDLFEARKQTRRAASA